ncbi:MAG: M1 family aminopeptidase, partial [Saprospiraceae bacterium]
MTFSFTGNDNLQINLPAPLPMGILDSLMVDYEGAPNSTGFGSFETTIHAGVPLMWTLSEPYGAKVWWPCKQDLNDKIDSIDVLVTTPMPYRAASNGVLVEEAVSGNTVRYHWRHRYPIPAYLIAFAVTDYATFSDYVYLPDGDSIEILNYVFHPDLIQGQNELSSTVEIMELYNDLFGIYPFADEKYGHAQFGWGGGMEHQTMSFMGGFSYGLQAHELAHQWFGDKVTCGSWEDIWLNEGFATYLTGLTSLYLGTPQEWESWKTNNLNNIISQPDGSVWVDDTTSVGRIFSGRLSYKKGAYVLHMLRWQLGDDAFYQGIQNYLNDPALAYGYARTPDLQQHLEASSGQDLEVFFDQWFYGEGYPSYHAIWEPTSNGIRIQLDQTTSDPSIAFFQMPVPVRVNASGLDTILRLDHQFSGQVFEIELPDQPLSLEVDPEKWLISGNNTVEMAAVGTEVWSEMGLHVVLAPNPVSSHLQVYARSSDQAFSLKIYDLVGRLMYE